MASPGQCSGTGGIYVRIHRYMEIRTLLTSGLMLQTPYGTAMLLRSC
jgi:hypothetical protein